MTTNRQKIKKYLPQYYTIHVYRHIPYICTRIKTIYHTNKKGILHIPKDHMVYKIRPLHPNKYKIQQTTHPILKSKYNTPNNRMIQKYKTYKTHTSCPNKYNMQQQDTHPTLKPTHNKYQNTKLQTKYGRKTKQIHHPTNKDQTKRETHPKQHLSPGMEQTYTTKNTS